jgi:hypothetical protein
MKPFSRYIDYDLKHKNMFYYIAIIFLIFSHFIHYTGQSDESYIIFFKSLFVISYLAFFVSELFTGGRIHIVNLVGRTIIIIIVLVSIYSNIKLFL